MSNKRRGSEDEYEAIWDEEETKIAPRSPHNLSPKPEEPKKESKSNAVPEKKTRSAADENDSYDNERWDEEPSASKGKSHTKEPPKAASSSPAKPAGAAAPKSPAKGAPVTSNTHQRKASYGSDHYSSEEERHSIPDDTPDSKEVSKNVARPDGSKPAAFVAKGSAPTSNVKGTVFPSNIQVVARIRPFTKTEKEKKVAAEPTATTTTKVKGPTTIVEKVTTAAVAAVGKELGLSSGSSPKSVTSGSKSETTDADLAVPFRSKLNQPQSILRIGLPDQGIFQNFSVDKVAWCLGAPHEEPNTRSSKPTTSSSSTPSLVNEQLATWEAVGPKLIGSIVYPMGWEGYAKRKSSTAANQKGGGAVKPSTDSPQVPITYGNACVLSYGAVNSGKTQALFGAIDPPAPPAAPSTDTKNASAAAMANNAADLKSKDDAFYYANKNRAKRGQLTHNTKDESENAVVKPKKEVVKNSDLIKTAAQLLPKDELNAVVASDGVIVRAIDALLKSPACTKIASSTGLADIHMACLRLHNERLTDLCDLNDPSELRPITTQLYYPDTHSVGGADSTPAAGAAENEALLYYYGLRGVRPTKITSVQDAKELIVRARQQIQRPPAGYLARDVVASTKGKPNEKDLAVKAANAEDKKNGGVVAKQKAETAAAEHSQLSTASAVHGSTLIAIVYLVPRKEEGKPAAPLKPGDTVASTNVSLPPRTSMQKIMFVDLPYSNSISKGVSTTSINAGKEMAFTLRSEAAETPLQVSNDKAINAMFLALGSSLADSVRYARGRYHQHQHMLNGTAATSAQKAENASMILEELIGSAAASKAASTSPRDESSVSPTSMGPTHYRNSTLTRILKEATYGPNTFTTVLGCVSPSTADVSLSHHTLRFIQAIKNQPVVTIGYTEMEALRLNNTSAGDLTNIVVGSLPNKATEAFDLSVERKAAEKAKVNPYMTMKTGGTVSSGAVASLAPPNAKREENAFFKNESNARAELAQEYSRDLTALQRQDVSIRLLIAKKFNMPRKLAEAIADGNAAIGTSAANRGKKSDSDDDGAGSPDEADFEAQFRVPHKTTTSPSMHNRLHITNDTSAFLKDHHQKYRFKDEAKGTAHVTTNTLGLSNRAYSEKIVHDEEVSSGHIKQRHRKEGPPVIAHKKKKDSSPETSTTSEVAPKPPHKPVESSSPTRPKPKSVSKAPTSPPPPPAGARPSDQSPRTKQLQPAPSQQSAAKATPPPEPSPKKATTVSKASSRSNSPSDSSRRSTSYENNSASNNNSAPNTGGNIGAKVQHTTADPEEYKDDDFEY